MRTYVATTGVIFGLLVIVHLWRAVVETHRLATDPLYVGITLMAALLCAWAARLVWRSGVP